MIIKEPGSAPDTTRVTFRVPATVGADTVHIVGDFNDWNRHVHPLKQGQDGSWQIVLELQRNRTYHFRYLINGSTWQNDWQADEYATNPFGGE
ncbi:MAG TPA: glycoside hydrolase family 13, partial [Chloroflexi bacterium]|nr:glycoside hydrolase family 13 [Chloroflexota bacterium]